MLRGPAGVTRGNLNGAHVLSGLIITRSANDMLAASNQQRAPNFDILSPRRRHSAALLSRGHHNKYIAKELGIAAGTVKQRSRAIFGKLGVRGRDELISRFGISPTRPVAHLGYKAGCIEPSLLSWPASPIA
jgi:DNA-binding CsgD family transcriptional regulator